MADFSEICSLKNVYARIFINFGSELAGNVPQNVRECAIFRELLSVRLKIPTFSGSTHISSDISRIFYIFPRIFCVFSGIVRIGSGFVAKKSEMLPMFSKCVFFLHKKLLESHQVKCLDLNLMSNRIRISKWGIPLMNGRIFSWVRGWGLDPGSKILPPLLKMCFWGAKSSFTVVNWHFGKLFLKNTHFGKSIR